MITFIIAATGTGATILFWIQYVYNVCRLYCSYLRKRKKPWKLYQKTWTLTFPSDSVILGEPLPKSDIPQVIVFF